MIKFNKLTKAFLGNAKGFGTLFTYMSAEAIYLKLAGEIATVGFIQALSNITLLSGQVIQNKSEVTIVLNSFKIKGN